VNSNASSPRATSDAPAAGSAASHEVKLTALLVVGAVLLGTVLQVFVPPGPLTLVTASVLAGAVVLTLAFVVPGRIRATIAGFRFTSTLLVVLAVMAIGGTLILQGKPAEEYAARYGGFGAVIVSLRLDDIFHGLPFALVMALFGAGVISSATLRWPVKARNAGFFVCHVGLITSLIGASASTLLSRRGMVWLPERGDSASAVVIEKGRDAGTPAPLGFDIKLDQFDLDKYASEHRIGFYTVEPEVDPQGRPVMATRLKTSFDACSDAKCTQPDTSKHVLPGGDTFRVKAYYPDYARVARPSGFEHGTLSNEWRNPAALVEWTTNGQSREELVLASRPQWLVVQPERSALLFEKREEEAKAFTSHVTVTKGGETQSAVVTVNDPLTVFGWTFYQNSYRPREQGGGRFYTGLEAVHDPGVPWVFTGFFLICVGVSYMFYVEPRLKGKKAAPAEAPASTAAKAA
jgi:hypothetical protein